MMQVLLHEIGHVVEWYWLKGKGERDQARAEGFATWFEYYASEYSEITRKSISRSNLGESIINAGRTYIYKDSFAPDLDSYANAAAPFAAIVSRRGIYGLAKVYNAMSQNNLSFNEAIKKELGWSAERLMKETSSL